MAIFERKYCWSILLRLFHWMFALSIVVLVTTGFYINRPWTNTMVEGIVGFPMANMRYMHFIAGYVFASSVIIRIFLYIFGNAQERIGDCMPVTKRNLISLRKTLVTYSYIKNDHDDRLGHNPLAGMTYLFTFIMALVMILSGFFMLYPENMTWQGWGLMVFGSQQDARFLHHLCMWWFIIFMTIHLYLVIWNDCKECEGIISSIFTGAKYKHKS